MAHTHTPTHTHLLLRTQEPEKAPSCLQKYPLNNKLLCGLHPALLLGCHVLTEKLMEHTNVNDSTRMIEAMPLSVKMQMKTSA